MIVMPSPVCFLALLAQGLPCVYDRLPSGVFLSSRLCPTEPCASTTVPQSPQRDHGDGGNTSESARTDAEHAEDLQFSDELAATMSTEALRDLASVLGRLSATRTKVLTSLVEKRDELRHERSQRQALVEQLVMQVDRSRSLRKVKAPGSRR